MSIQVKDAGGTPVTINTINDLLLLVGEVQADPTANTLLARLKALQDNTDGLEAAVTGATPAGELHIGEVGGNSAVVGAAFNRPADTTTYAVGDVVAPSPVAVLSFSAARKNGGTGVITGVRLSKSTNTLSGAVFRVHFFKNAPVTLPSADNVAFAGAVSGIAAVAIGYVDVTMDQAYTDGAKGFASINAKAFAAAGGSPNLYALIEARGAYTPGNAETFTLEVECLRD